jgi:hypothetical protein
MNSNDAWDRIYRTYSLRELGWELRKPRPILREFIEKRLIHRVKRWTFVAAWEQTQFT